MNRNTVTGQREDMVLVPRRPTKEMLYAAADAALGEDAAAVWEEMIAEYERSLEQGKLAQG
jgi:hypothetical protein